LLADVLPFSNPCCIDNEYNRFHGIAPITPKRDIEAEIEQRESVTTPAVSSSTSPAATGELIEPKWLIDQMIPLGYTVLLASESKAGKSSLASAISLAVVTVREFTGRQALGGLVPRVSASHPKTPANTTISKIISARP